MEDNYWTQFQAGDELTFQDLYNSNADLLYGYGMKIAHDTEVVTNAIQSLFIYLFEKKKNLSKPNSVTAYLCTSLKHIILNELSNAQKSAVVSIEDLKNDSYDFNLEIDRQTAIADNETKEEQVDALQKELSNLTKQQREMIYLKYYKNLSTEEIAEIMGVTERTVYNTTHAAIKRLRDELGFMRMAIFFAMLYCLQMLIKK